jgi:hypothetical protein
MYRSASSGLNAQARRHSCCRCHSTSGVWQWLRSFSTGGAVERSPQRELWARSPNGKAPEERKSPVPPCLRGALLIGALTGGAAALDPRLMAGNPLGCSNRETSNAEHSAPDVEGTPRRPRLGRSEFDVGCSMFISFTQGPSPMADEFLRRRPDVLRNLAEQRR